MFNDCARAGAGEGLPLLAVHEARAADPVVGALGGAVVVAVVGEAEVADLLALVGAAVATGSGDLTEASRTDLLVGGVPHLGLGRSQGSSQGSGSDSCGDELFHDSERLWGLSLDPFSITSAALVLHPPIGGCAR